MVETSYYRLTEKQSSRPYSTLYSVFRTRSIQHSQGSPLRLRSDPCLPTGLVQNQVKQSLRGKWLYPFELCSNYPVKENNYLTSVLQVWQLSCRQLEMVRVKTAMNIMNEIVRTPGKIKRCVVWLSTTFLLVFWRLRWWVSQLLGEQSIILL